jgi:hypothetical protein
MIPGGFLPFILILNCTLLFYSRADTSEQSYGHRKFKFLLFLFCIWLFCCLAAYVFLSFVLHKCDTTNLSSVMEQVFFAMGIMAL